MTTLIVDDRKRVRIPDAKPGQVFACEPGPGGSFKLIPVKAVRKERFPRGSLLKYCTPERDAANEEIYRATVKGPE